MKIGRKQPTRKPPVHIPLDFDKAVEGLLAVEPKKKPAPKKRRPAKKK